MHTVYALKSLEREYIYVGMTNNLERRLHEHNAGNNRTTKPYRPFEVIYSKGFATRNEAREHEKGLKTSTGKRYLRGLIT